MGRLIKITIFLFLIVGVLSFLPQSQQILAIGKDKPHKSVCSRKQGVFSCHSHVIVDGKGKPDVTTAPSGYGPQQFLSAYKLASTSATPKIVAIVDAYDHPSILNDLNTYSNSFGIPPMSSCPVSLGTPTSPCFQKVDQNGGTNYPSVDSGWALETSLDVETLHGVCQNCSLLLVEAKSASYADLMAAVDRAVAMGATVVSNSYGSNEFSTESFYDSHFAKLGIAFTFSSGDSGYGAEYPASSRYVTAVGGTTLNMMGDTYLNETVWNGAGSGCSSYEGKPSWQKDTGCLRRMVADVSADADPNTGAAVFDSVPYFGSTGWYQVGGTSLASPIIAATFALAADVPVSSFASSVPYAKQSYNFTLRDVLTGSNGNCRRKPAYFCQGQTGYDGPSGLGTPLGFGAF